MIEYETRNDTLYFIFKGEVDESCATEIRNFMDEILEKYPRRKVVMDMEKLNFMDSTGIGLLLGRYKKITAKNSITYIQNPSGSIDRLLTISGIYQLMPKVEIQ